MNYEPFTSIENPTLAHFRHFSSLFTLSHLYICRESSTNQPLFMQNKPNFQKVKMNVSILLTRDYENIGQRRVRKNKPNSNPISNAHKPIKGAGRKKGLKNFFWVSVAGKDIIYWKSRFSLKFGKSSFECLSFWSLRL